MKQKIYQINSLKKLSTLAKEIINNLGVVHVIALRGELGCGKTAFAQAIAQALKIKSRVTSPSFVLTKIYRIPKNQQFKHLYHLDLYRALQKTDNNLEEVWQDTKALIIVEWPEKLKNLPRQRVEINIKIINQDIRLFTVRWLGIKQPA